MDEKEAAAKEAAEKATAAAQAPERAAAATAADANATGTSAAKKEADAKAAAARGSAPVPGVNTPNTGTEPDKSLKSASEALSDESVEIAGDAILGGPFSITGPGLGSGGTLTIGGQAVTVTRWDDRSIRGTLAPGTKGDVVLLVNGTTRRGVFPSPKKVVTETTTVTVKTIEK